MGFHTKLLLGLLVLSCIVAQAGLPMDFAQSSFKNRSRQTIINSQVHQPSADYITKGYAAEENRTQPEQEMGKSAVSAPGGHALVSNISGLLQAIPLMKDYCTEWEQGQQPASDHMKNETAAEEISTQPEEEPGLSSTGRREGFSKMGEAKIVKPATFSLQG